MTTSTAPSPYRVVPERELLAKPIPDARLPEPLAELKHGATYAAVYFAAVDGPDGGKGYDAFKAAWAELADVEQELKRNFDGKFFGGRITDCDVGAEPALNAVGVASPVVYISLYFESVDEAQRFAGELDPPALTVTTVQVFCLD